ncbi:MAG TPA: tyrosine-type recombinase/integrase [Cyclobacteriaceae bacterium]|nr:tyrosine-type recombinase/integrase [Cyclobacteriaceae bacterium]
MIDSFLNYLRFEKRFSPHTIVSYQNDLNQFDIFLKENYEESPQSASYAMVRSWIVQLVEQKSDPLTVNRKIASLRSYYKFLLRQEVISKDPMVKIKVLKTKKKLPHFVKEPDMVTVLGEEQFENTHEGWRERLVLELLYGTGMRLSELINLKENQVNLHEQTIKVLGKRNKERVIPFSDALVPLIKNYRSVRNKDVAVRDHGLLIVNDTGGPCYSMLIYRIVKKRLGKFPSVEKRSPHVLRHTYATHLLNKGAEINAVKDLLGHSSLAATQVYTHNSMEKLKKVFDQAHPKA